MLRKERRPAEDGSQEEFFCSELIAQAFKMAGVLKEDSPESYMFTPNSFSMKGQGMLSLTANTTIHRERRIVLGGCPIMFTDDPTMDEAENGDTPESQSELLS